MRIRYSNEFKKLYKKRVLGHMALERKFNERVKIFKADRSEPILRDHKLIGEMSDSRSFAIGGDVRVIYQIEEDGNILFVDIGSHNQVY